MKITNKAMKHSYCTYFDHNYLAQGIILVRSLLEQDPSSKVFVLALSTVCEEVLRSTLFPNMVVIPLSEIESLYPKLLTAKSNRTLIEYYFTITPFIAMYVLDVSDSEMVTYVDADGQMISSPTEFLEALWEYSVSITPHRFSYQCAELFKYGYFNVGWITYKRCDETTKCLDEYADDCISWCYDRLADDGRFGDQGYLTKWPDKLSDLKIINHKGVNTAIWNIDNYRVVEIDGNILIDDEPLVFYHFQGVKIMSESSHPPKIPYYEVNLGSEGAFVFQLPRRHFREDSVFFRRIIMPYGATLLRTASSIRRLFPQVEKAQTWIR